MESIRSHPLRLALFASVLAACVWPAHSAAAQDGAWALAAPRTGGATIPPWTPSSVAPPPVDPAWQAWDPAWAMQNAQAHAAPGGGRVLRVAQSMLEDGTVVRGSCFDWVDAVFHRVGGHWHDAFHSSIAHGPYAQTADLQPGDWVMFINESYGGDEAHTHSAIFVGWAEEATHTAIMMSYAGGHRDEPGRYGTYDLSHAYRIVRMLDDAPDAAPAHAAHRGRRRHRARS